MPELFETLEEIARRVQSPSGVLAINIFRDSAFHRAFTWKNLDGQAGDEYLITTELPEAQVRALNGQFELSKGSSDTETNKLRIYGLRVGEDEALADMSLSDRAGNIEMAALSVRKLVETDMIYGNPDDPDQVLHCKGLMHHAETSGYGASVSAGPDSGGSALSSQLVSDEMAYCRSQGSGCTHIVTGQLMASRLQKDPNATVEVRDGDVYYNGAKIVPLDQDGDNAPLLDFTEAAATGPATATSIYLVAHHPTGYYPAQNGIVKSFDLARTGSQVTDELRGLFLSSRVHPLAVRRIKHIKKAPVEA